MQLGDPHLEYENGAPPGCSPAEPLQARVPPPRSKTIGDLAPMSSIAAPPSLQALPDLASIAAEPSAVKRAARLGELARTVGTLPPAYARLRVSSLLEALTQLRVYEVAALVGVSPSRISQLTSKARIASGVAA